MALERKGEQHVMAVPDKFAEPVADYIMTTRDYVVRVDTVDVDAAITVTLPPVAEAKGRIYSVFATDATNALPVTVTNNNSDSWLWPEDVVLNEGGRGAVFYSDGLKWHYGEQHFTSSLIAGAVNLGEVHLTMDTAGLATVDVFIVRLESDVALGNSAGAIFAQVDYDSGAGRVGGLSYAIGAEMKLPNHAAIPSGHYCCIDYEMSARAATDWGGGTKVSYMRFACWGTQTNFDDNAFWFTLAAAELEDHLVSVNAFTIRCQIEALTAGTNKERHVVLSETQNMLHQQGNVLSGARQMNIQATYDSGTAIEGVVAYFQSNLTAASAAVRSSVSIWTNLNEAPGAGGITRNIDSGIYTAIDLTGHTLHGFFQDMCLGAGGAPADAYQFGFNHSGHALTAFIYAENLGALCMDAVDPTGAGGAADARIKVRVGGGSYYLAVYDA